MGFLMMVAFDTNMLLNIARFKVDVFSEAKTLLGNNVEFVVPKQVFNEVSLLCNSRGKVGVEARLAKKLLLMRKVSVVEVDAESADDALKKLSKKAIIATNDKELKDSVRKMNGRVLFLRQRKFLELS